MFTKSTALANLRDATASFDEDAAEVDAVGVMADYLDDTSDYYFSADRLGLGSGPGEREFLAELAGAFQAGYEHAVGEHARGLSLARRVAGLSV